MEQVVDQYIEFGSLNIETCVLYSFQLFKYKLCCVRVVRGWWQKDAATMDTDKQVECKKNRFQNAEQVKKPNIHSFKIPN